MKKLMCVLVAAAMLAAVTACKKENGQDSASTPETNRGAATTGDCGYYRAQRRHIRSDNNRPGHDRGTDRHDRTRRDRTAEKLG